MISKTIWFIQDHENPFKALRSLLFKNYDQLGSGLTFQILKVKTRVLAKKKYIYKSYLISKIIF